MLPRTRVPAWLPLLPAAVCLADVALTLRGQPASYWQGQFHHVNEGNPVPRYFLERHPALFGLLALAWVGSFALLLLVPRRWAVPGALAIVAGHTVGAASWLLRLRPGDPRLAGGFVLAVIVLALPTWRARRGPGAGELRRAALPPPEQATEDQGASGYEHQGEQNA